MIMISKHKALAAMFLAAGGTIWAVPASAQANRTWVSGVGDDTFPCSRTAPCKTFAGALSKTAAGGEINCLDPGGFGAVTITKSISIICDHTLGGDLAAATHGVTINAAATDTIFLSGIDINGTDIANPGFNGVRILAAGTVHIQNSIIRNFRASNGLGVRIVPSTANTQVTISNTTITSNGTGVTGGGILVTPGAAGSARVVLRDVLLQHNANNQLRVDTTGSTGGVTVIAENSQFIGGAAGISVNIPNGTGNGVLMINNATIALTGTGIAANGTNARLRVANSTITANAIGVSITGSANVNTFGNNRLEGNGSDGAFTLPIVQPE